MTQYVWRGRDWTGVLAVLSGSAAFGLIVAFFEAAVWLLDHPKHWISDLFLYSCLALMVAGLIYAVWPRKIKAKEINP